uniref:ribosomal protein S13 n=1 Tax=Gracilaria isabellana TaxID=1183060 RepID=UPI001D10E62C|nr:ribosomal protein S13 [Gracilaria isabellana]YP_010198461.1 ribosomal protein S13 [Gracilaria pachydermatica]YP_010198843.1 ribosomal protein S13 [Gracilaria tikvahiae]UAD86264.1 ribosomal protein S13 [Gracilaria isabellana]UAD86877.1 ribosomal protein S13 [Gracilaria pachydermatica]UAD88076.1 ribosomal protein S13 [Gracilaria tikvahiae]UAD88279.1 ribosomal protein S13 [Gracilaria tikvahiae]
MIRIVGVDLPKNKRIEISLTYIYGIGKSKAIEILEQLNINRNIKTNELNDEQIVLIRQILSNNYQVEGDLKRIESMNIKRLMTISSYKGKRHQLGLPLRGQNTRTNARTKRGIKKTMAGKKKAPRK